MDCRGENSEEWEHSMNQHRFNGLNGIPVLYGNIRMLPSILYRPTIASPGLIWRWDDKVWVFLVWSGIGWSMERFSSSQVPWWWSDRVLSAAEVTAQSHLETSAFSLSPRIPLHPPSSSSSLFFFLTSNPSIQSLLWLLSTSFLHSRQSKTQAYYANYSTVIVVAEFYGKIDRIMKYNPLLGIVK